MEIGDREARRQTEAKAVRHEACEKGGSPLDPRDLKMSPFWSNFLAMF